MHAFVFSNLEKHILVKDGVTAGLYNTFLPSISHKGAGKAFLVKFKNENLLQTLVIL